MQLNLCCEIHVFLYFRPIINDNKDRRKNDRSNGRDRTRQHHNKSSNIVKAGGVFSEGNFTLPVVFIYYFKITV